MKSINRAILSILLITLILSSCKVSYLVTYQTYLEGSSGESSEFNDSIINVRFDARPNGILFDIENLTSNNLYLIWDKSYFIEPNGESSKALNQDVLETTGSIRDKENYESIIPQKAHFKRFTCSSKNISLFDIYTSLTFYSEALKSLNTVADYSKFYKTGTYWYLGEDINYSSKNEIPVLNGRIAFKTQREINENNNLALGFTIKNREIETEYHFKFPIKSAEIYNRTSSDQSYKKIFELSKENNFDPNINKSQTSTRLTESGIIVKCLECGKEFKVTGLTKGEINCPYCNAVNYIDEQ